MNKQVREPIDRCVDVPDIVKCVDELSRNPSLNGKLIKSVKRDAQLYHQAICDRVQSGQTIKAPIDHEEASKLLASVGVMEVLTQSVAIPRLYDSLRQAAKEEVDGPYAYRALPFCGFPLVIELYLRYGDKYSVDIYHALIYVLYTFEDLVTTIVGSDVQQMDAPKQTRAALTKLPSAFSKKGVFQWEIKPKLTSVRYGEIRAFWPKE